MTPDIGAVDLAGQVALVTHVADDLGFQIASMLAQSGAHVHIVNADQRVCVAQVDELRRRGQATGHVVDLQDDWALKSFAALIAEEVPQLNILVSNVRVACPESSLAIPDRTAMGADDLLGDLCLIQELLPCMRDASTVADPARVIVLGDLEALRSTDKSGPQSFEPNFVDPCINLNFVDVARLSCDGSAASAKTSTLLAYVRHLSSPAAAQLRGEVAPAP